MVAANLREVASKHIKDLSKTIVFVLLKDVLPFKGVDMCQLVELMGESTE